MTVHPLRSFRESRGWSQAELARFLGVSRATLNRWEQEKRRIGLEHIPAVAEKTGIPARELRPDWAEAMGDAA